MLKIFPFPLGFLLLTMFACKTAPSPDAFYKDLEARKALELKANEDPCPESAKDCHPRQFIVADDGLQKVSYINLDDPSKDWDIAVESTIWDLSLTPKGQLTVTTSKGNGGYLVIDIAAGKIVETHDTIGFVRSVERLASGTTRIAGENLGGETGTVIIELDEKDELIPGKLVSFPKIRNSRVVRRTGEGHYLLGSTIDNQDDHVLMEMDEKGQEIRRFPVGKGPAHMGLRLKNGDTLVTSGRDLSLLVFDEDGRIKQTIAMKNQSGKPAIDPFQAGFFQRLANGHIVMTNWQGKNVNYGTRGRQLVEYNAKGDQVWAWKQDPKRFSSISAVLVLNGF